MTLRNVIRSITLIVVISFIMAWLGQYILYHYNIAEAVCLTNDCPETTKATIISTSFVILLFSAVYLVFINPDLAVIPGMEVSILLSSLILNFIYFSNTNAFLCLIPFNIVTAFFYFRVKKQLNKPFALYTFIMQEIFLLLMLVLTYVFLDELFVTKGLPRDTVLPTGTEKMLGRIIDFLVWTVFILHVVYITVRYVFKKQILRYISFNFNKGPLP